MSGPSETPNLSPSFDSGGKRGPERGRNLFRVTEQGQAELRPECRLPDVLLRTCCTLHEGPSKTGHHHLRTLAPPTGASCLACPHLDVDSFCVHICVPEFPEP